MQNIGLPLKEISQSFQLPANFKLGGNYVFDILKNSHPNLHTIMLTGDIGTSLDDDSFFSLGLEYSYNKMLYLRTGYQYSGDEPGFKAGFGVKYKNFGLDYAFIPLADLGNIHKISLSYRLKTESEVLEKEEEKVTQIITSRGIEIALNDIMFEFDKADLKPKYLSLIDKAIDIIKQHATNDIIIEGHTDAIGSDEYNIELSKARAKNVYDYLISKGLDAKQISYVGLGKKRPIADNTTEAGRARNRRVYIVIIKNLTPEQQKNYDYYFYNGLDFYYKEGYALAIEEWTKALEIQPNDPKILNWIEKAKQALAEKEKEEDDENE